MKKTGSKPESKPFERKKIRLPPEPVEAPSSDGEEDEDSEDENESDEEDDGVDEIGFENLIKALGDDGLDEYDQAHLVVLAGDEEEDEENGESENVEELGEVSGSEEEDEEIPEEGNGAEEGGSRSGSEDILVLDELEDVELHPDAVPRRGVEVVNNKVRVALI